MRPAVAPLTQSPRPTCAATAAAPASWWPLRSVWPAADRQSCVEARPARLEKPRPAERSAIARDSGAVRPAEARDRHPALRRAWCRLRILRLPCQTRLSRCLGERQPEGTTLAGRFGRPQANPTASLGAWGSRVRPRIACCPCSVAATLSPPQEHQGYRCSVPALHTDRQPRPHSRVQSCSANDGHHCWLRSPPLPPDVQ